MILLFDGGRLSRHSCFQWANQIWERDLDKLMDRTSNRPIPSGHLSVQAASIMVIVLFIAGTTLLWMINLKSALLGISAFLSYVFLYTPLKTRTPWAVFVGAFPGAIPPMLGAIAATDALDSFQAFYSLSNSRGNFSFLGHRLGYVMITTKLLSVINPLLRVNQNNLHFKLCYTL